MTYLRQSHPHPSPKLGALRMHPRDGLRGYVGVDGLWDTAKYYAGQSQANALANAMVDEAEGRGTPATTVAAWRSLLVDYNNANDLDSIQALAMEAQGWSSAGNAGVITTQISDSFDAAKAKISATIDAATSKLDQASGSIDKLAYFGIGLAIFYVYVSARR